MTSDLSIARVVIVCDAVSEHRVSIAAAARFAGWFRAGLHGIFVEDEALLHLAGMPFAKHVGAAGHAAEGVDERAILHQFDAHAARVRAALASCAAAEDISWSFDVLRGPSNAVGTTLTDRDLLVIEAKSRAFANALQLDSRLLSAALKAGRPLLLLRDGGRPIRKIIALVQEAGLAANRLLTASATLAATVGRPLLVLLPPRSIDAATALKLVASVSEAVAHRSHIEHVRGGNELPDEQDTAGCLLVVNGDSVLKTEAAFRQFLAKTSADLLILR